MTPERALASMLQQGGADFSPRDVVAFTKLAEGLSAAQTLDEVLWAVAHEALGTMQLEDVVIYLVDRARGLCVQAAAYGPKNPEGWTIKAPIEIPIGKGVVGRVARSGEPALVPDVSIDPDYIPDDVARLSELTVPIIVDGEVIGVIDSEHSIAGFLHRATRRSSPHRAARRAADRAVPAACSPRGLRRRTTAGSGAAARASIRPRAEGASRGGATPRDQVPRAL